MLRSTTVTPALLLALAWCGPDDARPGRAKRGAKEAPAEAPAPRRAQAPEVVAPPGRPGLVLFVVLDTVRADHTSLCGHDRPTTPFLQALAGQQGWSHTCGLVTPGTWTLPSHASFFTGLLPTEHRLITKGHPLPPGVPTLAERFAAEGYQTVLLSANPTLNKASGIGRGFEVFESSPGLYAKRDRKSVV